MITQIIESIEEANLKLAIWTDSCKNHVYLKITPHWNIPEDPFNSPPMYLYQPRSLMGVEGGGRGGVQDGVTV